MPKQIKEFIQAPWTARKVWALISVPLSVAGIASITQSLFDLGSLIIYVVLIYGEITDKLMQFMKPALPADFAKSDLNYFVIGSPFIGSFNITATKYLFDYTGWSEKEISEFRESPILFQWLSIIFEMLLKLAITAIFWPVLLIIAYITILWPDLDLLLSMPVDQKYHDMKDEALKDLRSIVGRTHAILLVFFALSAFSFGLERWVDPDFLRIRPEHLGFG